MSENKQYTMTTREAANYIGHTVAGVTHSALDGRLPFYKEPGITGKRYFNREDLDAYKADSSHFRTEMIGMHAAASILGVKFSVMREWVETGRVNYMHRTTRGFYKFSKSEIVSLAEHLKASPMATIESVTSQDLFSLQHKVMAVNDVANQYSLPESVIRDAAKWNDLEDARKILTACEEVLRLTIDLNTLLRKQREENK